MRFRIERLHRDAPLEKTRTGFTKERSIEIWRPFHIVVGRGAQSEVQLRLPLFPVDEYPFIAEGVAPPLPLHGALLVGFFVVFFPPQDVY
jgi:hypothetical protein